MSDEGNSDVKSKVWVALAVAGILFFLAVLLNGGEAPWKPKVLFDCPPIGDEAYVQLDPHEYHPECKYFGPPIHRR
jgi:hypothetical protein